ncbi:MAG: ATP synthase subunit delta [Candidatus Moranbacteria bacterium GW2011_GWE2_35_2-]|nr:MAG: ATP synthase subunit delta [Candidatus Moranbacteria bacterium GW2011_GWE2_35_2-]KKQ04087.1 MAG: ATP synthase subunit delta [Candidatus Moranbacteria bacterium GW2011_GWF1_36_4]KKQ22253.1 MAG: ATP synthase subunit delta [Candidatus Moranbacteria bacterium GW2011_GWF2_37_11]KKQ28589.1 MAG: ATP synthase subunit delta [Candidatus Moranbacteria bacterium GW2011_GWD1_37_17]KKQ30255.1 MAG: ATP synthase subunit delta [Candidatus Moranbacteria bacterium GW2011_GWE1_37_24]KKQ47486.1 MAG: ATP sy
MKVNIRQYARALYELTAGKSEQEIDSAVVGFVKILTKNRQAGQASKIIKKFNDIYNKENGVIEAEIEMKYKMQDAQKKQVEEFIEKKYNAKEIILRSVVSEKVGSGMILRIGDEIMDGSTKRQLQELRNNLIV